METFYFVGYDKSLRTMIGKMLASRKCIKFFDTNEFKKDNIIANLKNKGSNNLIVSVDTSILNDDCVKHYIKTTGRVLYLESKEDIEFKNVFEELENYKINTNNMKIDDIFREVLAIYNTVNKIKCHIFIK